MGSRRPNPQDVGDRNIAMADRAGKRKPPISVSDAERATPYLHMPVARSRPPLLAPEPVDVSRAMCRPPTEWEMYLIIEARQQERARELDLFRGLS